MSNFILFDDSTRQNLLPLTFTRPIADIRIGITSIREKWEAALNQSTSSLTNQYLQPLYPLQLSKESNVFINGSVLPNPELLHQIHYLQRDEAIVDGETVIAIKMNGKRVSLVRKANGDSELMLDDYELLEPKADYEKINWVWDIFRKNAAILQSDFGRLTKGRNSKQLSKTNILINPKNIFIEAGATVEGAILNASTGPIYIGKNALIMEGVTVRGPLAMCEKSVLKMGAKIYGATTLGPYVKIGGEVNNSVIFGYSNKGHDGFLGNSVIGEWCNLGADTNNSNLKNNYGNIRIWNYEKQQMTDTGLQFCGLIMGDHAKSGINTMFNTGTVVGVAANVYGGGFPPKFVPSYAWGSAEGFDTHQLDKALETAERMYKRRNRTFTATEQSILRSVFEETAEYRTWEV